jgi:predicted PurR-regulated permease PerM
VTFPQDDAEDAPPSIRELARRITRHENRCVAIGILILTVLLTILGFLLVSGPPWEASITSLSAEQAKQSERMSVQVSRIDNLTSQVASTQVEQQKTSDRIETLIQEIDRVLYGQPDGRRGVH